MAKITEQIDLTLDSLFAGDSNPKLKPARWRENNVFFDTYIEVLNGGVRGILENFIQVHHGTMLFFSDKSQEKERIDCELGYVYIFKEFPDWAFKDTMGWGDHRSCSFCGVETNLLNRNSMDDCCDLCSCHMYEKEPSVFFKRKD